jgi:hypothetical protein
MNPPEFFILALLFGSVAYWVVRPIAAALAKRIAGEVPRRHDDDLMENVLTEVRELRDELNVLSERVDFTERVLAKQREEARLGRGES